MPWKEELESWVADHEDSGIGICSIDEKSNVVTISVGSEHVSLTVPHSEEDYYVSTHIRHLCARLSHMHTLQLLSSLTLSRARQMCEQLLTMSENMFSQRLLRRRWATSWIRYILFDAANLSNHYIFCMHFRFIRSVQSTVTLATRRVKSIMRKVKMKTLTSETRMTTAIKASLVSYVTCTIHIFKACARTSFLR